MTGKVAAIVLTGGRASRLDGADKAGLQVDGQPMVETVLAAASAVAGTVVTVGPGGTVREDPPFSGPVAGIAAGLDALGPAVDLVVVVSCDLPDLDAATLRALVDAVGPGTSAALAVDAAGRDQYLLAAWGRRALAARISDVRPDDGSGAPVRALYDDDEMVTVRVMVGDRADDVDTWADLAGRGPVAPWHVGPVLRSALPPVAARTRAPLEAIGSVLTGPLTAADPMPRGRVSAMDGYALAGPGPWRLTGFARRAGDDARAVLDPGTAAVVATGALAPDGADRVLRHELVEVTGGATDVDGDPGDDSPALVTALPDADGVDDLRPIGEDWPAGHVLADAGTVLDAALASAALSGGLAEVPVRGPVRATVVTTGDEVLPAGTPSPLPEGRIRDTVGPLLGGVLARAGFAPDGFAPAGPAGTGAVEHCPDTADAMTGLLGGGEAVDSGGEAEDVGGGAVGGGADAEVLVLVGATGRGVADHLRSALETVGARVVLDGVRVRPGGSQLVALLPDGRVLLGLPGNPLAAVCAAATTGRALVDALTGRERTPALVRLDGVADLAAPRRSRILPARPDGTGGWIVARRARTAHLADLAGAPALALIPEAAGPDTLVELLDWT